MIRGRALGPGNLRKDGRGWVLDWTDEAGHRRRRMLGSDRRTSERVRSEIIHRRDLALAGLGAEAGQELTLAELLPLYLADLATRTTPMHLKNVRQRLGHVVERLGDKRIADLKPMDVLLVRNQAVTAGASHRTANLLIDRLRAMLRWCERNELISRAPLQHIDRLPESQEHRVYRRRALSEDEICRFLGSSEEDDARNGLESALAGWTRVPTTPIWRAFLETGARYGELRQVRWGDIDFQRGQLTLRAESTKARKVRVIPLRRELLDELARLRVIHEAVFGRLPTVNDVVFLTPMGSPWRRPTTNLMRQFDRVLDAAGIAKRDPDGRKLDIHALRHTAATRLARVGAPLLHAQRILGHSDPKLTAQIYTHIDAEDLRGAVESLPPTPITPGRSKEAR